MITITGRELQGILDHLFKDGTIPQLIEIGKRRECVSHLKRKYRDMQEKNRLLKRKIRNFKSFNSQGGKNGKSKEF